MELLKFNLKQIITLLILCHEQNCGGCVDFLPNLYTVYCKGYNKLSTKLSSGFVIYDFGLK
jgi:hypothetical protein